MSLLILDRKVVKVPIESHPVFAEARDHALVKAGYSNPTKHRNRIERVRTRGRIREFYIWARRQR